MHTHTTARSHTARFTRRLRVALTAASRLLRLLVSTRKDIKFPTNPSMKDRQYMVVSAIVLGSWRVQSSIFSKSVSSLEDMLKRVKGTKEVAGSLWAEDDVVEIKGKAIREEYGTREEGNDEGTG